MRLTRTGPREPSDPRRTGRKTHGRAVKERLPSYKNEWYVANKDRIRKQVRNQHLLRSYGITDSDFSAILLKQSGLCAICSNPPKSRNLHVDHCHKTGRVRGLLCSTCNTDLAVVEDSRFVSLAKTYLKGK